MLNTICNESGAFSVDGHGVLRKFECGEKNNSRLPYRPDCKYLLTLHIPEGVRVIPKHFFVGYCVKKDVTFPDSLVMMGKEWKGAFFRCKLDAIVLPENAWVGKREFAACHIRRVDAAKVKSPEMLCRLAHGLRFSHCYSLDQPLETWPQEYQNIYLGRSEPRESWTELRNESGAFWVDSDGVLMDFSRDRKKNYVKEAEKNTLLRLNIPEGVTALHRELFSGGSLDGMTILEEMTLPDSLRYIGANVFACCHLPSVVLPPHLEVFGDFAFGASRIRSVTIRGNMKGYLLPLHVREFRDVEIGEIRVPVKYREALEAACKIQWGNDQYEIDELFDDQCGSLCRAYKDGAVVRSENIVLSLLREIAYGISV